MDPTSHLEALRLLRRTAWHRRFPRLFIRMIV